MFGLLIHHFGKKPVGSGQVVYNSTTDTLDTNIGVVHDPKQQQSSGDSPKGGGGGRESTVSIGAAVLDPSNDKSYNNLHELAIRRNSGGNRQAAAGDVRSLETNMGEDRGRNNVGLQGEDQVTQVEGQEEGGSSSRASKKQRAGGEMSPTRKSELERDLLLCELRVENCDLRVNNLSNELGMI